MKIAMQDIQRFVAQVSDNIERVIIGKRNVIEILMVALLCDGHVLLEDVPGTGETMLARFQQSNGGFYGNEKT